MRRHLPIVTSLLAFFFIGPMSFLGVASGQQKPTARLTTTATIKGMGPRMLQVSTEEGDIWWVSVPNRLEQVLYQGSATPRWLRPGMFVRFYATLPHNQKRPQTQEKVDELTVVTLRPGIEMGIFPEAEERASKQADVDGGEKTVSKKKLRRRPPLASRCMVIAQLREIKGNRMEVAAGRIPVRAVVSDSLKVSVEVNDYRLAREGDKVELRARYFTGRKGRAEGEQLTITASKPLAVARQARRQKRSDRGQKTDGAKK